MPTKRLATQRTSTKTSIRGAFTRTITSYATRTIQSATWCSMCRQRDLPMPKWTQSRAREICYSTWHLEQSTPQHSCISHFSSDSERSLLFQQLPLAQPTSPSSKTWIIFCTRWLLTKRSSRKLGNLVTKHKFSHMANGWTEGWTTNEG